MSTGAFAASVLGGAAFSPLSLAPHVWLDPSDLSTLFQDAAMTTPVTADSDPVGAILDKSGNGLHLTQATAGDRPIYRTAGGLHWLEMRSGGTPRFIDRSVPATQPVDTFTAWRRNSTDGSHLYHDDYLFINAGLLRNNSVGTDDAGPAAPDPDIDFVVTERIDGASSRMAVDNDAYVTFSKATGEVPFEGIGGSNSADARFYGLVRFSQVALTDASIASLRTYLASKQGRVL